MHLIYKKEVISVSNAATLPKDAYANPIRNCYLLPLHCTTRTQAPEERRERGKRIGGHFLGRDTMSRWGLAKMLICFSPFFWHQRPRFSDLFRPPPTSSDIFRPLLTGSMRAAVDFRPLLLTDGTMRKSGALRFQRELEKGKLLCST